MEEYELFENVLPDKVLLKIRKEFNNNKCELYKEHLKCEYYHLQKALDLADDIMDELPQGIRDEIMKFYPGFDASLKERLSSAESYLLDVTDTYVRYNQAMAKIGELTDIISLEDLELFARYQKYSGSKESLDFYIKFATALEVFLILK